MDYFDKNTIKNKALSDFLSSLAGERKIPPLERWSPDAVTPFDVIIKKNGDWYHDGTKMTRQSLVDLFASVLWAEYDDTGKRHFLKTPTDKYEITVEDAPLLIHQVDVVSKDGVEWIVFTTTHGDVLVLDDNPLYFNEFCHKNGCEQRLYLDTRFNLTARIHRNVFYHLAALGELTEDVSGQTILTLYSGGRSHHVIAPME